MANIGRQCETIMIRYLLAILFTVVLVGLTLQGLTHVSPEQSDRQVQGELTKIDEAATSLMREEPNPHSNAPGARRYVTLSLPQESMTTTQAGELRLQVSSDVENNPQSATVIEYAVDGHHLGQQTVEAPIQSPADPAERGTYSLENLPTSVTDDLSDESETALEGNLTAIAEEVRRTYAVTAITDDSYLLLSPDATHAIDAETASLSTPTADENQQWAFESVGDDVYRIQAPNHGNRCLDLEAGTGVGLADCDDSASQHWEATYLNSSRYHLVNSESGQAVTADAGGLSLATLDEADSDQQWTLRPSDAETQVQERLTDSFPNDSATAFDDAALVSLTSHLADDVSLHEHTITVPPEDDLALVLWLARDDNDNTVVYLETVSSFEGKYD